MEQTDLQRVRQTLGWTQERMARWVDYSPAYYARMERGTEETPLTVLRSVLVLEHLYALCGLVGFDV